MILQWTHTNTHTHTHKLLIFKTTNSYRPKDNKQNYDSRFNYISLDFILAAFIVSEKNHKIKSKTLDTPLRWRLAGYQSEYSLCFYLVRVLSFFKVKIYQLSPKM
jgi:hypothetical protein